VVPKRFPSIVDDNKLVAARTTNPIAELTHDHRELSGLLIAVHEALSRVDKNQSKLEDELHEIGDGIEAFREHLLDHFAREQEGLLPFVVSHLPRFRDRSETLIIEHDRIAESLTKVVTSFHSVTAETLPTWRESLTRFEDLYATHTKSENAFLDEVAQELSTDRAATDKLRDLINA
jgi:hemerythrin-like domain-containing protein